MASVGKIADDIIAREGGFVNDPDDPGGATNFGITIGTLRRLGWDRTGDGRVDIADVRTLTHGDARKILLQDYYFGAGIHHLPEPLRASVFDMQVNAGSQAGRILQRLLNEMGAGLVVDGAIGPRTAAAAKRAFADAPDHLVDAYGIARRNYYYALADRRAASRKYVRRRDGGKGGWITRAEDFIAPRFHLNEAAHRARVAAWG